MWEWITANVFIVIFSTAGLGAIVFFLRPIATKIGDVFEVYLVKNPKIDPYAEKIDDILDKGISFLKAKYADKDWIKFVNSADKLYDIFAEEAGLRDELLNLNKVNPLPVAEHKVELKRRAIFKLDKKGYFEGNNTL